MFAASIIIAAEEALRRKGYSAIICHCNTIATQEIGAVNFALSKGVKGIIDMPLCLDEEHLVPALKKNIPIVLVDDMIESLRNKVSAVLVDNADGAERAVSMLVNAGHKHIGAIVGPSVVLSGRDRLEGYLRALKKNGIPVREEYIFNSDYSMKGGYDGTKQLVKNEDISAIFATNYDTTMGAYMALNDLDIQVPERLSIIGFDNYELANVVRPKLSIITQPMDEIGKTAVEILLEAISKKNGTFQNKTIVLPTGLFIGDTIRQTHSRNQVIVNSIKDIIQNNYADIKNMNQISQQLHFSSSYIISVFKKHMDQTIFEYLQSVRMEAAKELLQNPHLKIYEIAEKVGYQSSSFFTSLFKQHYGYSPKQFRDGI